MRLKQRVTNFAPGEAFRGEIAQREEISKRLAHLLPFDEQMRAVHPMFHERLAGRAFALGNLVLVMRKFQILATEMQVEACAQHLHAHGGTFDVPAGPAFAPWAGPEDLAVLRHACLPERKIG